MKKEVKAKAAPKKEKKPLIAAPIPLTEENRRDETDPLIEQPAEWNGIEGTVTRISEYDLKTGFPKTATFRPRNNPNSLLSVNYDEINALLTGFR